MLHAYLEDLEQRIDPEVEEDLLRQWQEFWEGPPQEGVFRPRRRKRAPSSVKWPKITVNESLEDVERMALRQLSGCSDFLAGGSGRVMNIRANYGTGTLPSLFGAEIFVMDAALDTLPTTKPIPGGTEGVKRLLDRGVPDLHGGYGGKCFTTAARYLEWLKDYPKVSKYVHVYHPDVQGPMDVCEMLWGSDVFVEFLDQPAVVKAFLGLITETYVRYMQKWLELVPPRGDYAAHWGYYVRGRVVLRNDSAMNLSGAMYEEFVEPFDQQILDAFGGGAMHFCGKGDHYIHRLGRLRKLYAVDLSQPQYNDMELIYKHTLDCGIKLLGLNLETAEAALRQGRALHGCVQSG